MPGQLHRPRFIRRTRAGDTERNTHVLPYRRLIALTSALTAAALAISACGGSTDSGRHATSAAAAAVSPETPHPRPSRRPVQPQPRPEPGQHRRRSTAIAAEVPQAIRDRGTLLVTGSAGTAPPLRFYATDDTTLIGSEVDFAYLIADVLGLEVETSAADWAQNFVRIDSGEVDAFISNVTVTEERKEKYDFATYRLDTLALETQKDTDWTVNGRRIWPARSSPSAPGTNQEKILVDWNEPNVGRGPGTRSTSSTSRTRPTTTSPCRPAGSTATSAPTPPRSTTWRRPARQRSSAPSPAPATPCRARSPC